MDGQQKESTKKKYFYKDFQSSICESDKDSSMLMCMSMRDSLSPYPSGKSKEYTTIMEEPHPVQYQLESPQVACQVACQDMIQLALEAATIEEN